MTFLHPLFEKGVSLFMENPAAQSLGFIAMAIGISGFLVMDDKKTIKIFIIATFFWLLHFIFLGNMGALGATMIGLIRLILSLKYQKSVKILTGVIFASIIGGFFSFDGTYLSLLPLLATSVSSYGFFFLEKVKLRLLLAGVSLMWLTYHLNTGSMSGVLNETIVQITILYSVYKFITGSEKKEKILTRLKRKIGKAPVRVNFGRYIFLRDRDRFE